MSSKIIATIASIGSFATRQALAYRAPGSPGAVFRQQLLNLDDAQYTAEINVGGQSLHGILDTGSFELLVFDKQCGSCGPRRLLYDHTSSSSYTGGDLMMEHTFGSGETFSLEAYDTVSLGPLHIAGQHFWEVYDAAMPILAGASFQAIVGVGPADSAEKEENQPQGDSHTIAALESSSVRGGSRQVNGGRDNGAVTSLTNVSSSASLSTRLGIHVFSVVIGQARGSPGYFIWNDDAIMRHPEVFTKVPVAGSLHWALSMTAPHLDGEISDRVGSASLPALHFGCEDGCAAVVDSGTSLLAAPTSVVMQVKESLKSLRSDCRNLHEMPDLVFSLGGHEFRLPPTAYIGQVIHRGPPSLKDIVHFHFLSERFECVPMLMPLDIETQLGPMWILGLPFFRKYYTTFMGPGHGEDAGAVPEGKVVALAEASPDCTPAAAAAEASLLRRTRHLIPLRVDVSKMYLPRWAKEAAKTGRWRV